MASPAETSRPHRPTLQTSPPKKNAPKGWASLAQLSVLGLSLVQLSAAYLAAGALKCLSFLLPVFASQMLCCFTSLCPKQLLLITPRVSPPQAGEALRHLS